VVLARGDLAAVGLVAPAGGWRRWARLALVVGLVTVVVLGVGFGLWLAAGRELLIYRVAPSEVGPAFLHMCVFAPLLEEIVYRVVLCVPLAAAVGGGGAVAASGVAFGLLHVVYGTPSPENLLGGFILAWSFVRSGSVSLPLLLHAPGNLLVLGGQVAAWYLL
jgi:membrane protease YdiL (CAAX protease family)